MKIKNTKAMSFLMAGVLAASLSVPAFAADISIDGHAAEYKAYQLLELTTSLKPGHTEHEGEHTKDCHNYAYTVNAAYREALKAALLGADADGNGDITDAEIIDAIGAMEGDAAAVRQFADAVYASVKSLPADKTTTSNTLSSVEQGYYLIVESKTAADPDSVSLVMLDTAGQDNLTVTSKEDIPTLEKKIVENGEEKDAADYAANDAVSFRLKGSLPANIANYATYKYIFHDTMSAGLALVKESVKVSVNGVEISGFTVKDTGLDEGCSFEVCFDDLKAAAKAANVTLTADDKVIVDYNATLTAEGANTVAHPNTSHLEFSNDPYTDGETSKTPDDQVTAFTYKVIVNKVDKNQAPLAGANFELQVKEGDDYVTCPNAVVSETGTEFTFTGLDAGDYKLVETKVPDGYNKIDDIEFSIVAELNEGDTQSIKTLIVMRGGETISEGNGAEFLVVVDEGSVSTNVVNNTGSRLPSTGGAGTYLIYGGGAALVALSIAVVAKKKKNEETAG